MSAHRPRKRFGQHFLHDPGVVARIVGAFGAQAQDHVVEIGPGLGVLTRALADKVARLDAVELDRDLAARLREELGAQRNLGIHQADALGFDFCRLAAPAHKLRIIGNLPYNISTPLLFRLLDQVACIADMVFMLQEEVVDRLCAAPGGKDYGRLSVMIQWRCRVEKLFHVGPGAFSPPPRVDSAVVRLVPHAQPPVPVRDAAVFGDIVHLAFAHRRKTLRNGLKGVLGETQIRALGIDPGARAETLTLAEFARLADAVNP